MKETKLRLEVSEDDYYISYYSGKSITAAKIEGSRHWHINFPYKVFKKKKREI